MTENLLASAAVAAIVTGGFELLWRRADRKDRRKEMFLTSALRLAEHRVSLVKDAADRRGEPVWLRDTAEYVEQYMATMESLWDTGKVDAQLRTRSNKAWEKLNREGAPSAD